jgi:hypothetical protein
MVLLRDAGSLCGRRSETLEDRAGCRPRDVFRHRHPFKQRQKPRRDLAAREDTCFRHDRQIPNGTGSQVVRERLQRRPATAGGYGSDVATSPVSHSKFANPCGALCCETSESTTPAIPRATSAFASRLRVDRGHRRYLHTGKATKSLVGSPVFKLWNESRTNRARIADSTVVRIRSRRHVVARSGRTTTSCKRHRIGLRDPEAIR